MYTALSILPHDDHSYVQAPFEDITEEEYNERVRVLHEIDLTMAMETMDYTNHHEIIACAGGACEVT